MSNLSTFSLDERVSSDTIGRARLTRHAESATHSADRLTSVCTKVPGSSAAKLEIDVIDSLESF